ncbi:hypothetical protein [Streptomyces roseochromogenus]|uniref:Lipoprotein n=1 Tax=Streptomyces roseochromogenus subsp. oscitans DS 12.976 TaxID=1352936 RepID=V6KQQ7_STRRC|nr:hypothetical protein [Streptomyces roseochromogenus]EST34353.1 hypothetical protein M878_10175 [Streptomyces roseochromogenus subsp. oscitans DS 12.976]
MRKVLPLALTGLFALSACQFAGHDDRAEEAGRLNTMAALPLHAYLPDPASDGTKAITRAQWILGKQCMVRLGFTGFAVLDTKSVESTYPVRQGTFTSRDLPGDDSPYGVVDPDLASEHGYHNRTPDGSGQPQEWPADQYAALTGTFESGDSHVAHGHPIPEGGCLGQAARKLYGPPPRAAEVNGVKLSGYYSLAMELWYTSHKEASKDPAWKKADRAWSDCMRKQGFHYSDPDRASLDAGWFGHEKPSGKERKTAAADARCKLDTGYVPAVHALEARSQKGAIGRNKEKLDAMRAADERAMRKARTIIGDAS